MKNNDGLLLSVVLLVVSNVLASLILAEIARQQARSNGGQA